ncbi:hypothetical protein C5C39_02315 [Rathayibacter sp. AY1F3]|nr:hypothetical protein C5C39_02315 [Rathayibacter sp. AY1F3]
MTPSPFILLPGFVNAHAHSGMSVLRGVGDGLPLERWLELMLTTEDTLSKDDLRWALRLSLCEMIRSGTTAVADMFLWDDELIGDVVDAGLRCAVAPTLFGPDIHHFTGAQAPSYEAQLDATDALADTWDGHPLVRVFYGPHAVYTAGERVFRDVANRSQDTGIPIHVHLSETAAEVQTCRTKTGLSPVELAHRTGILRPTTLVAHAVHLTDHDIELLHESGATVVHNPASNLKLGSGIAPVSRLLAEGVPVALGTDGPASSDSLDMVGALRLAVALQRGVHQNADAMPFDDALRIATTNGSRALGFESTDLSPGSIADLAVLSTDGVHARPQHSAAAFLQWAAGPRDVHSVFVNGRPLMLDRELLTLDENRIIWEVDRIATRIGAEIEHRSLNRH